MHSANSATQGLPDILAKLVGLDYDIPEGGGIRRLFSNVNADFYAGGLSAILGPSGSGKSSLLSVLGGLIGPTSGKVFSDGVELSAMDEEKRCEFRMNKVGFIFQDIRLLPQLSAFDNIMYPAWFRVRDKRTAIALANEQIAAVGMSHKATSMPSTMSGGERQLIAFARILTSDPPIVLADEPTASLDWRAAELLLTTMQNNVRGKKKAAIIVTHDPRVLDWVDHVYHVEEGKLRYEKR